MKKLGSLLLGLGILGSSTLALADTQPRFLQRGEKVAIRERVTNRPTFDRDNRYVRSDRFDRDERYGVYRPSTTWQALTSIAQLGRNDTFDVRGRFAQLRLQNQSGRSYVRSIEVQFTDGTRQVMRVNQTLDGNHAMVNLSLDSSRRIDRIRVDGHSASGGSIQLYAM